MIVHAYYPLDPRVEREARILRDAGYEVDVICLRAPGEAPRERVAGVNVRRLDVSRRRGAGTVRQLREYVAFLALATVAAGRRHRVRRYGVVQVHNLPDFLVWSALLPRLQGARVLLDLHDLMPEFTASRYGADLDSWPVRVVRWQERASVAFADQVITVTDAWRDALIARGVPAARVGVVMNVADEGVFSPSVRSARPGSGPTQLLYHGTITHRYGLDLVLQALARVRDRVPVCLLVHGTGEYLAEVRRLTEELGLRDMVRFSDRPIDVHALARLIGSADVGLVPYRRDVFTDGILPTKLMEYAAVGIPAIASRTTAIAASFDDSMVRFVEPGDVDGLATAITELAGSPDERARLAEGIQRFGREHRFADVAASYLAIVDRLHATAGSRAT